MRDFKFKGLTLAPSRLVGSQLTNRPFINDLIKLAFQFVYTPGLDSETFRAIALDGILNGRIKLPLSKFDKPIAVRDYVVNVWEGQQGE